MLRLVWIFLGLLMIPGVSWARDFQICSSYRDEKVFVSYGYSWRGKWVSQGWFLVRGGRCLSFAAPLEGGQFYYFGYNEDKAVKYEGNQPFCVDSKPYQLEYRTPSLESCEDSGYQLRLFQSFDLDSDATETRIILEPPRGPKIEPIPYNKASTSQLDTWSAEGDASAKAELERRGNESKMKALTPSNLEQDMQENETTVPVDSGAFDVD